MGGHVGGVLPPPGVGDLGDEDSVVVGADEDASARQPSRDGPHTYPSLRPRLNPRFRKLSFTGSMPVGVKPLQRVAPCVLRTSRELGGNGPWSSTALDGRGHSAAVIPDE